MIAQIALAVSDKRKIIYKLELSGVKIGCPVVASKLCWLKQDIRGQPWKYTCRFLDDSPNSTTTIK